MPAGRHDEAMKEEQGPGNKTGVPVRDGRIPGPGTMRRRTLLKAMGASLALGVSLPGCVRKPPRDVFSRESDPEYRRPGVALHYSTTWTEGWYPYGMLVRSVDGRPVKIEGNPEHPINAGTSNAAMQAGIQALYAPDRLRAPRGAESWDIADSSVRQALDRAKRAVLLTRSTLGPSERLVLARFLERYPAVRHFAYEPFPDRERRLTWRELYGMDGEWLPRYDRASVILGVCCDFLQTDGVELESMGRFADRRVPDDPGPGMGLSRLYVAEGALTLTGTNADHRMMLRPSLAGRFVLALSDALRGADIRGFAARHGMDESVMTALADDLRREAGSALVVAGASLPAPVHAAVAMLNDDLGAPGRTLEFNPDPASLVPDSRDDIAGALEGGVDVLMCLGVDPVYDWPEFGDMLSRARLSVCHGLHQNATMSACTIGLPSHHNLESWNDAAPRPGLLSLCQPVIVPLHDTRQEAQSLMAWTGHAPDATAPHELFRDVVRRNAQQGPLAGMPAAQPAWEHALQTGFISSIDPPHAPPPLDRDRALAVAGSTTSGTGPAAGDALELVLLPHHGTWDGRFAGIPWLVEVPDPVTKQMWGNAAMVGHAAASRLGLKTGDEATLAVGNSRVDLPVLVLPGVADGVVAVAPGLGRATFIDTSRPAGVNAWALSDGTASPRTGVSMTPTGRQVNVVLSQTTFSMHGRPIVLDATSAAFAEDPDVIQRQQHGHEAQHLYPPWRYDKGHKWAMTVDLARCTGCTACSVACEAENNTPVVGPDECANGREMHWMRIDQYREGDGDDVVVFHEPMACQHCDNAPCEMVCPVNATNHSPEGLNDMVYNRCIGTRYCLNNCPYKVRRFNFFNYQKLAIKDPVQRLLANPNVTVRQIGVMEKCTFCVQRINAAKFAAANAGRELADGEIVPACAQACPARAIVFGDVNRVTDGQASRVAVQRKSRRSFLVLGDLQIGPNITYLARLRNRAPGTPPLPGKRHGHGSPGGGHG